MVLDEHSREKAYKETTRLFGYNGRNDSSDAFRHCYWSAMLSRDIGYQDALRFTTAHESDPSNPANEEAMDLHNKEVGLEIGLSKGTDAVLSTLCLSALRQDKLKVINP